MLRYIPDTVIGIYHVLSLDICYASLLNNVNESKKEGERREDGGKYARPREHIDLLTLITDFSYLCRHPHIHQSQNLRITLRHADALHARSYARRVAPRQDAPTFGTECLDRAIVFMRSAIGIYDIAYFKIDYSSNFSPHLLQNSLLASTTVLQFEHFLSPAPAPIFDRCTMESFTCVPILSP